MGGAHPSHEGDGREAVERRPRRRGAPGDAVRRRSAVEHDVGRVQEPLDVEPRRVRLQPHTQVGLVPDLPLVHPRISGRDGAGERGERVLVRRDDVSGPAAVRPARRFGEGHERGDAPGVEPSQDAVHARPVVGRVVRVERVLRLLPRDLPPVDRVPDDRHAELVQGVESLADRRAAAEVGVVLDPVADVRGRLRGDRRREGERRSGCRHEQSELHPSFVQSRVASTRSDECTVGLLVRVL